MLKSVFLVDDEGLIIKSLRAGIDWHRLGFEVIADASNGIDAYEHILKCKPDLVFADIRMPGLSGLEVMKKVHEVVPNTLFVMMSGYAEFAYVQKALTYGALGYCIKPFDEEEIERILKRAANLIHRNQWTLETEMLAVIDDGSVYGNKKRKELIGQMGFPWTDGEGVYVLVSPKNLKAVLDSDVRHAGFKIGKNKYAALISETNAAPILEKLSALDFSTTEGIGVSPVIHFPEQISEAIEEASIALNHSFVTGKQGLNRYFLPELSSFAERLTKLRNSVSLGDIPETVKMLDAFERPFIRGQYGILQAFQIYNTVMYSSAAGSAPVDSLACNWERLIGMFANGMDMLSYLKTVVKQTEPAAQEAFSDIRNEILRNIVEYVNGYYHEDISMQGISKKFNVNPCYTSQLFKRETGMTFTEYITNLRIKRACSLLETSAVPINEVSEKAGFNDYYYFTRVFKKVTGQTPTHYRAAKSYAMQCM